MKTTFSSTNIRNAILGLFFLLSSHTIIKAQDIDPTQMILVFNDEFDSHNLDWETWYSSATLKEYTLSVNTRDNVQLRDGNLVLFVDSNAGYYPEPYWNSYGTDYFEYTGGQIQTRRKFKYGYFEIRAKIPERAKGCVPAFWLFREQQPDFTGRNEDEIDVFEIEGYRPYRFQSNVHWYGKDFFGRGTHIQKPSWYESNYTFSDWHTYGVLWEETKVTFYYDRKAYYSYSKDYGWAMYIILTLTVNGNGRGIWDGPPDSTTEFPVELMVDYARVYKPPNCNDSLAIDSFISLPHLQSTFIADQIVTPQSGNEFVVQSPQHIIKDQPVIEMYASKQISLKPGFKVERNARFGAYLIDCPDAHYNSAKVAAGINTKMKSGNFYHRDSLEMNEIQNISSSGFAVYPNPADDIFTIEIKNDLDKLLVVDLIDIKGNLIRSVSKFNDGSFSIDTSELEHGVYFLVFYFRHTTLTHKIILN